MIANSGRAEPTCSTRRNSFAASSRAMRAAFCAYSASVDASLPPWVHDGGPEAMGGSLDIRAVFPDGEIVLEHIGEPTKEEVHESVGA